MDRSEYFKCLNDLDYLASKYFLGYKLCMSYDKSTCNGEIINAHTISKKFIKNISENNSVYYPTLSTKHNGQYMFKLKNINRATCFTGFCRHHDEILFQSFEKSDFSCSYKQIYDISFRALCREHYQKKCFFKFIRKLEHGELKILNKTNYTESEDFKSKHIHLLKEIKDHQFLYKKLRGMDSKGLNYIVIRIDNLPILATGVLFPLYYPNGEKFQGENKEQHGFIYSVISSKVESHIIISTVRANKNNLHSKYLKSLLTLDMKDLINYILTYVFFNNDNIAIKPSWLDNLEYKFRNDLLQLMNLQIGNYSELMSTDAIDFCNALDINNATLKKKNIF